MSEDKKDRDSLDSLTDKQNAILNELSYINIKKFEPGDNLYLLVLKADNGKDLAAKMKEAGMDGYTIKDYVNNNGKNESGFCAIAFSDEKGNVGIAFRGTETKGLDNIYRDVISDALTFAGKNDTQVKEAIEFFQKNRDGNGDNNYLYGHSHGGVLVSEVYSRYYEIINGAHVINAQPIQTAKLTAEQIAAFRNGKFDAIVINGDIVYALGIPPYPVRYVEIVNQLYRYYFPKAHNIAQMKLDENGNAVICEHPFLDHPFIWIRDRLIQLTARLVQFDIDIYEFAIGSLVNIYTYIEKGLRKQFDDFVAGCAKFFNQAKKGVENFVNDIVNFLNDVWDGLKQLFNATLNSGYQYALANPLLAVDTVRMRDYASRLTKVNNRVKNVDNRISKLYGKVIKIEDLVGSAQRLSKLIRANVLLGNSPKLIKSAEYLNNAATDFETAEKKIREKKP